jgi:hypothetical protein
VQSCAYLLQDARLFQPCFQHGCCCQFLSLQPTERKLSATTSQQSGVVLTENICGGLCFLSLYVTALRYGGNGLLADMRFGVEKDLGVWVEMQAAVLSGRERVWKRDALLERRDGG